MIDKTNLLAGSIGALIMMVLVLVTNFIRKFFKKKIKFDVIHNKVRACHYHLQEANKELMDFDKILKEVENRQGEILG